MFHNIFLDQFIKYTHKHAHTSIIPLRYSYSITKQYETLCTAYFVFYYYCLELHNLTARVTIFQTAL